MHALKGIPFVTNMLDVWRQLSYVFFVRMASAVRIFLFFEEMINNLIIDYSFSKIKFKRRN